MNQAASAWITGIPIVGLTSINIERLDEACTIRGIRTTADEMSYLEEPHVPKPVTRHVQFQDGS